MNLFPSKRIAVWSCKKGREAWWPGNGKMWAFCDKQGSASQHGQLYGNGGNVYNFHLHWGASLSITPLWLGARKEIFAVSKDLGRHTNWIFNGKLSIFINQYLTAQVHPKTHCSVTPVCLSMSIGRNHHCGRQQIFLTKDSFRKDMKYPINTQKKSPLCLQNSSCLCKWADHEW